MRLWHTELIEVLPRKQLLGQWRELNCIFAKWPNLSHGLVNFVYIYSTEHLYAYTLDVLSEMSKRGFKCNSERFLSWANKNVDSAHLPCYESFPGKMNDRYLLQCALNLQEKFDDGLLKIEEWSIIVAKINKIIKVEA